MDTPSSEYTSKASSRSSMVDSIRGCGLSGMRVDKEELKRKLLMPKYLRLAMHDSIRLKDPSARLLERGNSVAANSGASSTVTNDEEFAPISPMVVFINPLSGGRQGPMLKARLQQLMGEEQVFDLPDVKPYEFVQYGLGCLDKLASMGDSCAKDCREKMRVMVAGGDGTVGWVLGSFGQLNSQGWKPVPPVGIIPLGTGNDLSRSFGWGGSFPFAWKSAIKRTLDRATIGPVCHLDGWQIQLSMPAREMKPPHCLKIIEDHALDESLRAGGPLPEKVTCYEGVFYTYFSIGMDAQIAYGFHHLRNKKGWLAQGPISNKIIYSGYTCTQGWFFTPCSNDPRLRGLNNVLRMHVKKVNCSEWEPIPVPPCVRAIVALNIHNYASGRHPWGSLKPEYLEKRGFVKAHANDGLLEIFGLKQGWHASFVMVQLISAKHIAQAAAIRLEVGGANWKDVYMQMDGEPWKQPMNDKFSTFVEIKRVPFQSLVISGE